MGCNDDMLRLILARIERIEKTIESPTFFDCKGAKDTGAVSAKAERDLPFAPERLIYPKGRGDKKRHRLKTLMEVLEFQIRQVDRAVGDLPITIKVKDADPSKEGDQKVEAEFHSLAQAIKEMTEIAIDTQGDADLTNLMVVRALFELGFIHQGAIQTGYWVEAIADWLDFPIKHKRKRFPFAFNPRVGVDMGTGFGNDQDQTNIPDNENEFEKIAPRLLKETDVPIKVVELDPKQKVTDHDAMQEVLRAVRFILAAVAEEATPEKLDDLINIERLMIRMDGLLQRDSVKRAMVDGKMTADGG